MRKTRKRKTQEAWRIDGLELDPRNPFSLPWLPSTWHVCIIAGKSVKPSQAVCDQKALRLHSTSVFKHLHIKCMPSTVPKVRGMM